MTPDPRNVRDSLLTAGYSFEEVERMLRAASLTVFVATAHMDGVVGVFSTLEAAQAAVLVMYCDRIDQVTSLEWRPAVFDEGAMPVSPHPWIAEWQTVVDDYGAYGTVNEILVEAMPSFSPAEKTGGASTPHPGSETP